MAVSARPVAAVSLSTATIGLSASTLETPIAVMTVCSERQPSSSRSAISAAASRIAIDSPSWVNAARHASRPTA